VDHLASGGLRIFVQDDTFIDYMVLRVWTCPLVSGQWPPVVGSFWENGESIEYPAGTSWDMAFVLTTNREYSPRRWHWPPDPPHLPDPPLPTPNIYTVARADIYMRTVRLTSRMLLS